MILKRIFTICSAILAFTISAQNFQGVATYKTAAKLDFKMKGDQMTPDMQKRINERMAKAMQKEYELKFDKTQSIYKEVEALDEQGGPGRGGMRMFTSIMGGSGTIFKDTREKKQLEQTEFFGKVFLINDSLKNYDWKLEKGTKQIGAYTCYKATYTTEVEMASFFVGDADENKDSAQKVEIKERVVTVWYTPQIPISQGPGDYWGLPGLILEVNDGTNTILCSKVVLNPKEKVEIKAPSDGEKVTAEEYREIMEKKLREMEEMYGGRRGRRGGHGITIEMR